MSLYEDDLEMMLSEIETKLKEFGFKDCEPKEGMLMLFEVLSKLNAGFYASHTETLFAKSFGMLTKSQTLNKKGRHFFQMLISSTSGRRPYVYSLMKDYRLGD